MEVTEAKMVGKSELKTITTKLKGAGILEVSQFKYMFCSKEHNYNNTY